MLLVLVPQHVLSMVLSVQVLLLTFSREKGESLLPSYQACKVATGLEPLGKPFFHLFSLTNMAWWGTNLIPFCLLTCYTHTRQMNMNYLLCHAIQNTNVGNIGNIVVLYDINCQYHLNFEHRVQASKWIAYPFDKCMYFGIGAFYISGHIHCCFPWHSPQFIPGARVVDGEVLETLWAVLNKISPSTHTASLATRTEMLEDHMQDSNWKKLTGIGMWGLSGSS